MLNFFKRAFYRENRGKDDTIDEPPEAPDIPSIVITKNKNGKWVYEQPPNPDYDPETHTLTLKERRALDRRFESFIAIRNPTMLICPVDFDTMSNEMLEQSIHEAREYAVRIPKEGYVHVSDVLRLTFYVYFKQATEGDITESDIRRQPSMFRDWEGYWKVYGWKMAKGLPREEARDRYVRLFSDTLKARSDAMWAPEGFEEYFLKTNEDPETIQAREEEDAKKSPEQLAEEKRNREDAKWVAFFESVRVIRNFPRKPYQMPEPMRAMFYALYKQATVGDLRAFQKTEECQQNKHYAWCRQRPADVPVTAKKEKERKAKLDKTRKEREKRDAINRKSREEAGRAAYEWSCNVDGKAVSLSEPTSAVYDPDQEVDDPRTLDQLRYDFWLEQEGTEHFAAIRKYLHYFYRTAARHGYVWDPPGCPDHMSEVYNQYSTKEKKKKVQELAVEPPSVSDNAAAPKRKSVGDFDLVKSVTQEVFGNAPGLSDDVKKKANEDARWATSAAKVAAKMQEMKARSSQKQQQPKPKTEREEQQAQKDSSLLLAAEAEANAQGEAIAAASEEQLAKAEEREVRKKTKGCHVDPLGGLSEPSSPGMLRPDYSTGAFAPTTPPKRKTSDGTVCHTVPAAPAAPAEVKEAEAGDGKAQTQAAPQEKAEKANKEKDKPAKAAEAAPQQSNGSSNKPETAKEKGSGSHTHEPRKSSSAATKPAKKSSTTTTTAPASNGSTKNGTEARKATIKKAG